MTKPPAPDEQGSSTRPYLIRALEMHLAKREVTPKRKHVNIPL